MPKQTIEHRVDPRTLKVSRGSLYRAMGIKAQQSNAAIEQIIDEVVEQLLTVARPRYCYQIIEKIDFECGEIINSALNQGERFALLLSTLGAEVDELIHHYRDHDVMRMFVADAFASELAEANSRNAIRRIELYDNEHISNSYSPGYCGWDVTEQRKLFAHFEPQPCDIELTDSCLMLPIKSISAVVAVGKGVKKAPYGCAICTKTDCYKKR